MLQAGSTGQLSTTTAFANFAGCIARIFTSVQEGGGIAMVRGYILGERHEPVSTARRGSAAVSRHEQLSSRIQMQMLAAGTFLNGAIFLQIIYYSFAKKPKSAERKKKQ